ncbi:gamma-glutamyltransferase family protein [Ketogulonicigenium vulgare]|uniref:Gamma-glutamyltranspeptidase, putative n=1 Tax=Ketogulonicigenium vulgare (strain WSH-001) TaxID=759362 RepID=F9Y3Z3_KETVW|nr:gamma-glutamyltransferase family protein [Ketogulonicigenium vulgare]ADO43399.1 gamma-glutamyltransferase [Ketogulonicigenium vulgare Y25]AEM41684.1 Gamma-glutamyltranspeptidase, putative [Ketogulonicigenium vulgare WSH-001]ALJ81792.1 gamma-glutamyltransferase [Ketogulonicigenium vulgare]ANW34448.1 gamma-glutamyltransferase [Ketogulonicigenium vulgare]AOZ55434.1 gamma-glutamyltranspeptidase [Ketogulonicigenium vulgare]
MTKGAISSTHALATQAGADILAAGGNAFDAAVAAGLVLQVVEPHLNGPGGDLPAIFWKDGKAQVLCAQGPTPAGATIAHYKAEGLDLIPGDGLLATVIPGAFDGWMLLLRDHGTMELADVMRAAIRLADEGHPILDRAVDTVAKLGDFFTQHWPGSAALWLQGGVPPQKGGLFRNADLANTWRRIVDLAQGETREARIDAARDAFYRGFVAEAIGEFCAGFKAMDESGTAHSGVLTAADMAGYRAGYEAPLTYDYNGWTLAKTGPWGQGPVLAQALSLLPADVMAGIDTTSADFVHLVIEAQKLAFADRDTYYADPAVVDVPMDALLSDAYASARRAQISDKADNTLRPGTAPGFAAQVAAMADALERLSRPEGAVYEPTMAHLATDKGTIPRGDTVHLDVIDQWGNIVSATPSGGWLQSSPTIPGLGFCLNSRAQMFWLEPDLPGSLAPGKRPRTTLSPSLAWHQDGRILSFGTPGGDQQDQWQLLFFVRFAAQGLDLQAALDAPMFHSTHMPASFYPRSREPGGLVAEGDLPDETLEALRAKGHVLRVVPKGSVGRLTAALRHPDGRLEAAATYRATYGGAKVLV